VDTERQPDQIDVARLAGVSVGSVSTAINRPDLVSEKMRARVQAAIDELGYVPNRSAATLRRGGASRVLGLIIPEITNAFYAAIADAVVNAADKHNYAVSLCVTHEDPARERRHFEMLAQQRAAGALVVPINPEAERLAMLRSIGTRIILVDRLIDTAQGCSVAVDDVYGGHLAVQHLLSTPGEGITLVNGERSIPQCRDRHAGSVEALREKDRSERDLVEITVDEMTVDAGIAAAERILASGAPRRIFCINDQLATGVLEGLSRRGVSAPHDARVIGYGDLGLDGRHALSTIGQPKDAMGEHAVELLLDELNDGANHSHSAEVIRPHLIVRESTA
jgi:LacI family transcriptional regulator